MAAQRKSQSKRRSSVLSAIEIIHWADMFQRRVGRWPKKRDGEVTGLPFTTWRQIDNALVYGFRGLRGGTSLARFLEKHRSVRSRYSSVQSPLRRNKGSFNYCDPIGLWLRRFVRNPLRSGLEFDRRRRSGAGIEVIPL